MLTSFLPDPLHPAVVHLPIALAVLLPPFTIGALWAIRRGAAPMRAWGIATALFAALAVSSWVALETGEQTEERAERVVGEAPIESHEEAAKLFLGLSAAMFGVALVGLRGGRVGRGARLLGTAGAAALLVAGYRVGHSGGALVYQHGAAAAYAGTAGTNAGEGGSAARAAGERGEDDDR